MMAQCTLEQQLTYILHELDLSAVRRRFEAAHPNLPSNLVIDEYRKFLSLKFAHGDTNGHLLAAPKSIHYFWTQHVLDTPSYLAMLDRLGVRIHFNPDAKYPGDAAHARRLANAVDCYNVRFGSAPPAVVWGDDEIEKNDEDPEQTDAIGQAVLPSVLAKRAGGMHSRRDANDPFLTVIVKTLGNKTITVEAQEDLFVDQLHTIIQDHEGIPPSQQGFVFNGKRLKCGRLLMRDYGVRTRDVVILLCLERGC